MAIDEVHTQKYCDKRTFYDFQYQTQGTNLFEHSSFRTPNSFPFLEKRVGAIDLS